MAELNLKRFARIVTGWAEAKAAPEILLDSLGRNQFRVEPAKLTRNYLQTLGFTPATVFDVGVHRGTAWLYSTFPEAELVLIDPMPRPEAVDRLLGDRAGVTYRQVAVGAGPGSVTMHTPVLDGLGAREARTAMGVPLDAAGKIVETRAFEAEVVTLDSLLDAHPARPYGLKIDTEGFEYSAIEGAGQFLPHCQFVIVETTVRRRFADQKPLSAFLSLMAERGFEALEALTPFDRDRPATDLLFVPADSPLLTNEGFERP